MPRLRPIALLAASFVLAASCKVYDESLLLDGTGGFGDDVEYGNGIGWWSGKDPETGCATASMPTSADRPAKSDPGDSIDEIIFAIRDMRLGSLDEQGELSSTAWQELGFDLDGTCTRSTTCEQVEPIVSCQPSGSFLPPDGKYCRDNMFGRMEYAIATNPDIGIRFGLNDNSFNCSLCRGAYNMLFRVSDYNGQPNDASIRVDIYPSPGIDTLKDIDCDSEWSPEECWKPADAWMVQSDYVDDPIGSTDIGPSKLYDPTAYVRDGYAVVALPANTQLWFPDDRGDATAFPMIVQGGIVTGKMVQADDGTWSLEDGIIAGSMKVEDAVEGFRFLGMCKGDPLEATVEPFASAWADVLSSGAVLPDVACDAISVGIAFRASEAQIGKVAVVEVEDPCVDEQADAGADGGVDSVGDGGR